MRKKIKLSFFSFMIIVLIIFILGLIISTLISNKNGNKSNPTFPFNLEDEKYKGSYPDIIMVNGRINSNSSKNERIEIFYDRIVQYSTLNYMKIINPKITVFQDKEKIYYITSDIAFSENIDNIKIVNLSGNASINDLKQNIDIKGDLLVCNIERKEISSDKSALVIKDGFNIVSNGIFINNTYAVFKKDVKITNKTGLYDSQIMDEFINFKGYSETATFDITNNSIKMDKNATINSKVLDIKGDQVLFYKFKINQDQNNNYSQRIYVLNGHIKYVNVNNDVFYSKGDSIDYRQGNDENYTLKNGEGYFKDNKENSYIYFTGETVNFIKNKNEQTTYKINKGFFNQKKFNFDSEDKILTEFYSKGDSIQYSQLKDKTYILRNGDGYYKDYGDNSYLYFNGETVTFTEDSNKKTTYKINKGYFDQKKYSNTNFENIISEFYSKGDGITLVKYNNNNTFNCKNGFGYLYDSNENNNVIFSGNTINYIEKGETKISGNAHIYDLIGKTYVKGDELIYYDDKKIITSNKQFFIRQFDDNFNYSNQDILKGIKPEFEKDFLNLPSDNFKFIVNDISALKGKMNTEDGSSILEKKINIIDYQNLIMINSDYATYSGKDEQTYKAEKNLTIYQYNSIDNIRNNKQLESIIQSDKVIVYKKDNLAYFEGEPKIKNFKENFYIQSDLLEAHLDTKVYVFKDNIKLLVNTSENKELENQIYILGQYAVYDSEKKIITFSGPSILYQKNIELYVLEIFVDFNQKTINFKGIKDSKIKSIKF